MSDFMKDAINPGRDPIERQMIISEAIWELLKEKVGLTDEDLVKKVREIDLRDGVLDGRVKPEPPIACPKCGKKMKRGPQHVFIVGAIFQLMFFIKAGYESLLFSE